MLAALFLVGCGNDSQQARESLRSWDKSLELVERQYAQRRVPETYVRQMVRGATRALSQQRQQSADDAIVHDLELRIGRLSKQAP